MILDWLIRNSAWLVMGAAGVGAFLFTLRKFRRDWDPKLEALVGNSTTRRKSELPNLDNLLGGVLGGGSGDDPAKGVMGILNYVTLIVRQILIWLVDSKFLKIMVGALMGVISIAALAYPVTKLLDNATVKTIALEFPAPLCQRDNPQKLLIFIHGWNGDAGNTWLKFPQLVCADPRMAEFEVISISYPTYMANRNLRISELAAWVDQNIKARIANLDNMKVSIVAHSMGGLVAKEMVVLNKLSDTELIQRLVTIGSPHDGAVTARILGALTIDDEYIEDMTQNSAYLKGLRVRWNRIAKRPPLHCFSSPRDTVVTESSAFFQCDTQFTYPQWSHTEMVKPVSSKDERYLFPINLILQEPT